VSNFNSLKLSLLNLHQCLFFIYIFLEENDTFSIFWNRTTPVLFAICSPTFSLSNVIGSSIFTQICVSVKLVIHSTLCAASVFMQERGHFCPQSLCLVATHKHYYLFNQPQPILLHYTQHLYQKHL